MKLELIPSGEFLMGSPQDDKEADDEKPQHRVRITQAVLPGRDRGDPRPVPPVRRRRQATGPKPSRTAKEPGVGMRKPKTFEQNPQLHLAKRRVRADRRASGGQRELERRGGFRAMVEPQGGEDLPAADRSGMGIRLPRGDDDAAILVETTPRRWRRWATWPTRRPRKSTRTGLRIAARDGYVYTAPAGRFRPNAWGLYDMHGNVWEWCLDGYDADYYKQSLADDPSGVPRASYRVFRGGALDRRPPHAPVGVPQRVRAGFRSGNLGFRLARVQ